MATRYLFFDIECADGNVAICEFGFILTDESFRVLQAKNYVMNPKTPFNLTNRPGRDDVPLSYPYETYQNAPEYEDFYENIRYLLTQKDLIIFGHSVLNDILFLVRANKRYNLPQFDYVAYDIQSMFSYFDSSRNRFVSLDHAIEKLVPEEEKRHLISHRAVDDAYMTMLELKFMAKSLEFSVQDIIGSCPKSRQTVEEAIKGNEIHKQKMQNRYSPKKRIPNNDPWKNLTNECHPLLEKEESIGKIYSLSSEIKDNLDEVTAVINKVKKEKLVAFSQISGSDFLIVKDEKDKERLIAGFRRPYGGQIICLKDFLKEE